MKNNKKAIAEYDLMLQRHIDKKHAVKLHRAFRGKDNDVSGYLLKLSGDFVLVQAVTDFTLDGYQIVPKDCFNSLRYNKFDKALKKIMESENALDQYGISYNVDLENWQTLFTSLKDNNRHVILECEDKKYPTFTIGEIESISKKSVNIRNYDATGTIDKKSTPIKYSDITLIHFDEKYSTTFRKHLRDRKTKSNKLLLSA